MLYDKVVDTADYLINKIERNPKIGIILGSGLGNLINYMGNIEFVDYKNIPNFPISTVKGHKGRLVYGVISGKEIIAMQGRCHYYEGYSMEEVVYPIYVMKKLGVEKLIISNAAGGINKEFKAGDLMLITDFINFFKDNPLIGVNDDRWGERFPDMSEVYKKYMREITENSAKELGINLKKGVYIGVSGPYYETPAEINFFSKIGADAVGMSTVPESIIANYLKMDILGISCITNMATGLKEGSHSHEEVVETAKKTENDFCKLVARIISKL